MRRKTTTQSAAQPENYSLRPIDGIDRLTRHCFEQSGLTTVQDVASASMAELKEAVGEIHTREKLHRIRNNAKRFEYTIQTGRAEPNTHMGDHDV